MIRLLFIIHRYLGIAVGGLMAMWCFTGVVMMYVSYPSLDETKRLRDLVPIDWSGCCKFFEPVSGADASVNGFQLEMLAGKPVLYLRTAKTGRLVDLTSGTAINRVSPEQALAVARAASSARRDGIARTNGESPSPKLLDVVDYDQWTVAGDLKADRPLYHFALGNTAGTELYISSSTGHAVQETTSRQRFWNWIGAVPHWLYFSELRHWAYLWTQVVIVASLLGCFLVVIGLYIGIRQFMNRPAGQFSPYMGFNLWHHIAGLVFGVFTLTWILSGLLSMNPWGWLQGEGAENESALIRGKPVTVAAISAAVQAIAAAHPSSVVSLKLAPFNGHAYFVATGVDGVRHRVTAAGLAAPLTEADLAIVAGVLREDGTPQRLELLNREDDYYFGHHRDAAPLPVYRAVRGDESATRFYVDAVSGEMLGKIDSSAKRYRWLHQGLHRMDFNAAMRGRPQWDVLMLLLLSGVAFVYFTGAYLGYRRLLNSDKRSRTH